MPRKPETPISPEHAVLMRRLTAAGMDHTTAYVATLVTAGGMRRDLRRPVREPVRVLVPCEDAEMWLRPEVTNG